MKRQCPLDWFGVNGGFFFPEIQEFWSSHTNKSTFITTCS